MCVTSRRQLSLTLVSMDNISSCWRSAAASPGASLPRVTERRALHMPTKCGRPSDPLLWSTGREPYW